MRKTLRRSLFIALSGITLTSLTLISCNEPPGEHHNSQPKAAIIDQLSMIKPNPELIMQTREILETYNFTVDVWQGQAVTTELYRTLPQYGYKIILFRAHLGLSSILQDSKMIMLESTSLATGETYNPQKYTAEQLNGIVQKGWMGQEQRLVFTVNSRFIAEKMKGEFNDTIIMMMGCVSYLFDDMASAFIQRGASTYIGWNNSVDLHYMDNATLNFIDNLFTQQLSIEEAAIQALSETGPDPKYNSGLRYSPTQAGSQTIRELLN